MRAGVREVLQLPLVHRAFHEAMDRIASAAGVSTMRDGKVLAFISCKGGSGATFISTNFGYALATLAGKKVLLIDLHGQFGDATLYVSDQKPAMTLSDICAQIARIDGAVPRIVPGARHARLRRAGGGRRSGPRVDRPSPSTWTPSCAWRASTTTTSCSTSGARSMRVSLRALDSADTIYPVLQLALPDIRDGAPPARHLPLARLSAASNIRLIVNRYEKGGKLRLQDLQRRWAAKWCTPSPTTTSRSPIRSTRACRCCSCRARSAVARSLADLVELVTARRVHGKPRPVRPPVRAPGPRRLTRSSRLNHAPETSMSLRERLALPDPERPTGAESHDAPNQAYQELKKTDAPDDPRPDRPGAPETPDRRAVQARAGAAGPAHHRRRAHRAEPARAAQPGARHPARDARLRPARAAAGRSRRLRHPGQHLRSKVYVERARPAAN